MAPIGSGGTEGLVAGLREAQAPDFTTSDRKLVAALADQIASFVSSSRDALTGLLNRQGFERRLTSLSRNSASNAMGFCCIWMCTTFEF